MSDARSWLAVTGTRADFGLWMPVLDAARDRGIEPSLLVTAMHLDRRFGGTVDDVRVAGFPIAGEVPATPEGDTRMEMAAAVGRAIVGIAPIVEAKRPDWLLVLGDRGEQLAAALVGLHIGVPIAHLHGGERSLGAIDDVVRDMISRAADLHLVAHSAARERLRFLGIEPEAIEVVGAPGLDAIRRRPIDQDAAVRRRYGVEDEDYVIVVQHPETVGNSDPLPQLQATMEAVRRAQIRAIAVFANADAGGRAMGSLLGGNHGELVQSYRSIPHRDYIALLAGASALVGNSSSGIIEAPMLGVPVVNVGLRQSGRLRGDNVVDVPAEPDAIHAALLQVRSPGFRESLSNTSPYGDGHAAERIVARIMAGAR